MKKIKIEDLKGFQGLDSMRKKFQCAEVREKQDGLDELQSNSRPNASVLDLKSHFEPAESFVNTDICPIVWKIS